LLGAIEGLGYCLCRRRRFAGRVQTITNDSTNEAIKIYQADRNYPKFYRNFLTKSDHCLLGAIEGLGYCLCRRRRFAGRVLVKSRYDTVACLLSYSR
jgi:hypothetical protein